jgi:hypothetical protein
MSRKKRIPDPVDLNQVRRYSCAGRPTRTKIKRFGSPLKKIGGGDFFECLPGFLKASELNEFITLVARARRKNHPFHLLLGAHTIKVGLSPIIIDLMQRQIVTGLSFNSAGLIHDLELAFQGETSEDVQAGLEDGSFGMVVETARMYAAVCELADTRGIGLGEAAGLFINAEKAKFRDYSLFAAADRLVLPATVHLGVGTDTVAQHPDFDAALAAAASHIDFRILARLCQAVDRGGVLANIGSAVILPEVFLKALTVARNLKKGKSRLTTANFDMIIHYRPMVNVVTRPTVKAGRGFNFVGHHEIMIPLLAWGLRRNCNL